MTKESKEKYFGNYFQNNVEIVKITWKGTKSIISLKAKITKTKHRETITDPKLIADNFNIFFLSPSKKITMPLSHFKTIYPSHAKIHLL